MENSNKTIAQMLKNQRNHSNLSIKEVVFLLSKYYQINISEKTLYSWESGRSLPSTDMFVTLCDLYEVEDLGEAMRVAATGTDIDQGFQYKQKELEIIESYRNHPELQDGIKKILGIDTEEEDSANDPENPQVTE